MKMLVLMDVDTSSSSSDDESPPPPSLISAAAVEIPLLENPVSTSAAAAAATIDSSSHEINFNYKRADFIGERAYVSGYMRLCVIDEIKEELNRCGGNAYNDFERSCFGHFLQLHTEAVWTSASVHALLSREVVRPDASPDEFWFRIGVRSIKFSVREFVLITGLRLGDSGFDPNREYTPPNGGIYHKYVAGMPKKKLDDLRAKFFGGIVWESTEDVVKMAKVLLLYYVIFGLDGRQTTVDSWIWTLVEDSYQWDNFPWGKYSYQILAHYIRELPITIPRTKSSRPWTYHFYGCTFAFMVWMCEAIPRLANRCGQIVSPNARPRCNRWRFLKVQDLFLTFFDDNMDCSETLLPTPGEAEQGYWQGIDADLSQGTVQYIHRQSTFKRKRTDTESDIPRKVGRRQWSRVRGGEGAPPAETALQAGAAQQAGTVRGRRGLRMRSSFTRRTNVVYESDEPDVVDDDAPSHVESRDGPMVRGSPTRRTTVVDELYNMDCSETLLPTPGEAEQGYWQGIDADLSQGTVQYINRQSTFKRKRTDTRSDVPRKVGRRQRPRARGDEGAPPAEAAPQAGVVRGRRGPRVRGGFTRRTSVVDESDEPDVVGDDAPSRFESRDDPRVRGSPIRRTTVVDEPEAREVDEYLPPHDMIARLSASISESLSTSVSKSLHDSLSVSLKEEVKKIVDARFEVLMKTLPELISKSMTAARHASPASTLERETYREFGSVEP